uniref:Uncharacterized protein n=1 Tax=Salix viminalis TaxID=40686 RepID=A0A6N2MFL2_SALVM
MHIWLFLTVRAHHFLLILLMLAAEEQKKRKRSESNKKYREKIKKERKQAQSKTVQNESSRCKAQLESFEKSVMKPFLDEACKFSKLVLETGESSGHAIEAVEKQTDLMNSLSWELLKTTFNEHRELYIASEAQHAQEKVTLLKLHAQEMAATEDHHAQEMAEMAAAAALHAREMDAAVARHAREMAAAASRHAREMDAVKTEYSNVICYTSLFLILLLKNIALRLMNLLR